jgi:hypothetical protein
MQQIRVARRVAFNPKGKEAGVWIANRQIKGKCIAGGWYFHAQAFIAQVLSHTLHKETLGAAVVGCSPGIAGAVQTLEQ